MDNVIECENEFHLKTLRDAITQKDAELVRLRILLQEAGVEEGSEKKISDVEVICVQEIAKLRQLSDDTELDLEQVKKLEILHKNLKLARGETNRVGKTNQYNKMSDEELKKMLQE